MITLEQIIKLIPYYQEFKVQYYNDFTHEYICIMDSSYSDTDHNDFIKKYGQRSVVSVEAGRAEVLYICIERRLWKW